jgi:hypothetical protein
MTALCEICETTIIKYTLREKNRNNHIAEEKMEPVLFYGLLSSLGVLFLLVIILFVLLFITRAKYKKFMTGLGEFNVEELMHKYAEELSILKQHVEKNTEERITVIENKMPSVIRNVGMLSYNAFENMGNEMSFSTAQLDDRKNGLVITGIYGRDSSYVYAKEIIGGVANKELSKEEKEALRRALTP